MTTKKTTNFGQTGAKFDGGKTRYSLLLGGMPLALEGVAQVLTFGAQKYADHSWQHVPNGIDRYFSAFMRHVMEIMKHGPDARDEETGLLHIDHTNTNGLFLAELLRRV
jgi:hypothetical protein